MSEAGEIKEVVRARYAERAQTATSCCGEGTGPISKGLYDTQELAWLPKDASLFTLGCGNPTALAELHSGEVVLDLGSGAGLDVLLSARRVGPAGKVYGLDMTNEMLEVAHRNLERVGVSNVEFLKGEMENIPLPDAAVDVIISNCVVNLSPDKGRVLQEAFRVLKPGGRLAISDIVVRGEVPEDLRADLQSWTGCIAGALTDDDYAALLKSAGFEGIDIETTRVYSLDEMDEEKKERWRALAHLPVEEQREIVSRFTSSFVRALKPEGAGTTHTNGV